MSIKSMLAIPFAKQVRKQVYKWANNPHKTQERVFEKLIKTATASSGIASAKSFKLTV
mgnify:CR=1 FL=1